MLRRLWRERTLRAGAIAAVLVLAVGLARQSDEYGLAPKTFWAAKIDARGTAEIVLLGDSQTLIGVSPEAMGGALNKDRVFNFGFEALNVSQTYLDHAEDVLDANARYPAIVIGATALMFTEHAEQDGYRHYAARHWGPIDRYFGRVRRFLAPITTREMLNVFKMESRVTRFAQFHADGWLESDNDPPSDDGLKVYQGIFKPAFRGTVSTEKETLLLDAVRRWRAAGIDVYAFTPPVHPDVQRVIDADAGWDAAAFAKQFAETGGRWVEIDPAQYTTYDGVHLDAESARRLSVILAKGIAHARAANVE